MGNDGAEDVPAAFARPGRNENKNPKTSLYPNQGAFDDAIHMPTPSAYLTPPGLAISDNKPSHPKTNPGKYYFDTYSLVRNISKGGFTDDQSVTIMKAVEHILENNIDFTEQCLTSRYNFDNESYLFKAGCSQLRSSVQSARDLEAERQHSSRIQLQHEFNMLSQRLRQEITEMKDSIRGMLNDHSITIREHRRNIDTLLQELNYKINVSLNGDGKAAIEGIRWILTSRAALTVATCACRSNVSPTRSERSAMTVSFHQVMIVFFLKFYSVRMQDSEHNIKNKEENQPKTHVSTEVCKTLYCHPIIILADQVVYSGTAGLQYRDNRRILEQLSVSYRIDQLGTHHITTVFVLKIRFFQHVFDACLQA